MHNAKMIDRKALLVAALTQLDSLHDRFLFDKSSDYNSQAIEEIDAKLRALLKELARDE